MPILKHKQIPPSVPLNINPMKRPLLLFALFCCASIHAQTAATRIPFQADPRYVREWSYQFGAVPLRTEFTLPVEPPVQYAIEIIHSNMAVLSVAVDGKWVFADSIAHHELGIDSIMVEMPQFSLTDFNQDGYPDLNCWIGTNMNGNRWMTIFLFNPATHTLERLRNTAEQAEWEIWDNPEYDPANGTINCFRMASAYGVSFESQYRLVGLRAFPVKKTVEDRSSMRRIIHQYYVGVDGQWKEKKKRK